MLHLISLHVTLIQVLHLLLKSEFNFIIRRRKQLHVPQHYPLLCVAAPKYDGTKHYNYSGSGRLPQNTRPSLGEEVSLDVCRDFGCFLLLQYGTDSLPLALSYSPSVHNTAEGSVEAPSVWKRRIVFKMLIRRNQYSNASIFLTVKTSWLKLSIFQMFKTL